MTVSAAAAIDSAPIRACTIAREIGAFDDLVAQMDVEMPGAWGDLSVYDAVAFLGQPEAVEIEFVAVAISDSDEDDLPLFAEVVRTARDLGYKVIVVANDITPMALHQLMSNGADGFVPYPLPQGALSATIARVCAPVAAAPNYARRRNDPERRGVVLPVHGLAGGTGASTLAVNLAWELATADAARDLRVCLIDLDLQFGSVGTYLDLRPREAVFEMLTQTSAMDREAFEQALVTFGDKLSVLTAPAEIVPLDLIGPEDISRLVAMARASFDYVVIDMPKPLVMWTETVLTAAQLYFVPIGLDLRSAQNALRTIRALKTEDLPAEKLRYVLNRAPGFGGRSRIARLADSLDIQIEVRLPDGGKAVAEACDAGQPLALAARRNPLRKEIARLAARIHALDAVAATA